MRTIRGDFWSLVEAAQVPRVLVEIVGLNRTGRVGLWGGGGCYKITKDDRGGGAVFFFSRPLKCKLWKK